ncbi:FkbM family methyltransferase [soil metagenome]
MAESFRSPRKVLRRLRYLPLTRKKISNWLAFIYHYALGLKPAKPYLFRNGAQLMIGRAIDHVPIIEIFLDEEYGTIPNDAVVLDLGANIGVFSIYATTTARNLQVYAYEPYPAFSELLKENVRLNQQMAAIRCFDSAVAGEPGNRSLQLAEEGFFFPTLIHSAEKGSAENQVATRCVTLTEIMDDNALADIDLLKMDCEGAEYEILYATPASHLRRIRELRMEYHNLDTPEHQIDRLEKFLAGHGFTVTQRRANSRTNGMIWLRQEDAKPA